MIFAAVAAAGESQIYRDLMRFKPEGLSPNAWAVRAGVSRTVWADMRKHGNPSRRTLERLLVAAGSSIAEFEALRIGPEFRRVIPEADVGNFGDVRGGWNPAPLRPLPLIASSLSGEWGEDGSGIEVIEIRPHDLLGHLSRPASLAADSEAFALTVVGDSMWPRFRPGSRVAVSPRSPVSIGDDVLVRLRSMGGTELDPVEQALVMQLVKRTASAFELRQFNPALTIEIETDAVNAVEKIVGELI